MDACNAACKQHVNAHVQLNRFTYQVANPRGREIGISPTVRKWVCLSEHPHGAKAVMVRVRNNI